LIKRMSVMACARPIYRSLSMAAITIAAGSRFKVCLHRRTLDHF
jgi:hypothetical protein